MKPESVVLVAVLLSPLPVHEWAAAQVQPGESLQQFLHGNDKFGLRLLAENHADAPEKNAVVAPLSLTVLLSAIEVNSWRSETREQIQHAFGWERGIQPGTPAKMLLATMKPPDVKHVPPGKKRPAEHTWEDESLWIENRLLYRSKRNEPPLLERWFIQSAEAQFRLKLVDVGDRLPTAQDLRASRIETGRIPEVSPLAQVWLSSGTHLRQTWEELFMQSHPHPGEFRTEAGQSLVVQRVDSVLEKLQHLKTDRFESVVLPCGGVSMVVVLPREGLKIRELEEILATEPDALKAITPSLGFVTMPIFTIRATVHLESALKAMGIKDIFENLEGVVRRESRSGPKGTIDVPVARVTDIAQAIDFTADKHGIHADAETIVGAIPGGLIAATNSFRFVLNRPFVFQVRENASGALLFAGALMDPNATK
ncbi:MAG TPA: serpin family protein [Bryobacteraceae bacterium]|nr:serpin family protein [Bryobacteraceae bacterium]